MAILDRKKIVDRIKIGIFFIIIIFKVACIEGKDSNIQINSRRSFTDIMLNCISSGEKECLQKISEKDLYVRYDFVYFIFRKNLKIRKRANEVKDWIEFEGNFDDFYKIVSDKNYEPIYFEGLRDLQPRKYSIKEKATIYRNSYKDVSDICGVHPILFDKKPRKIQKQKCIMLGEIENDDYLYQVNYICDDYKIEKNCRVAGIELL